MELNELLKSLSWKNKSLKHVPLKVWEESHKKIF
jgi:hypothetical protein